VRDLLIGKTPDDVDIATSALPGKVKSIFPQHDAGSEEYGKYRTDKCDPIRESDCIDCMACETACPTLAVKITPGA